jgi:hypothetical protein
MTKNKREASQENVLTLGYINSSRTILRNNRDGSGTILCRPSMLKALISLGLPICAGPQVFLKFCILFCFKY